MKQRLKNLLVGIKKYSILLKLVFFGSILFFVVNQMMNILQGMTWKDFQDIIQQQGKKSIWLMSLAGFIGVLPLLLYDWVTVEILEKKGKPHMERKELFISAWIVNTINNLAGFGGIVGATLRANFYGKTLEKKKVVATVSKVALFLLSGLSILSFISLCIGFIQKSGTVYQDYRIWFLGGSLLAPTLLFFIYLKRYTLFKDFSVVTIVKLYLASLGQWLGALFVFLAVGFLMKIPFSLSEVFPLFVAATLIGMITMVPGGMGTFDVLIILGLSKMGISKELAVVWLLYYRIFYYLIPFLTGLILLIHQTGTKVNYFFDGLPEKMIEKVAHILLVMMVYFAGIMMILLSTVPNLSNINSLVSFLMPFSFQLLDQSLNLLVGFLLLGLARGLANRVRKAYLPTIFLLLFCIVNMISRTVSWKILFFYTVVIFVLFLSRKEFYRKQLVYSWGGMLVDIFLFGFLVVLYSIVGFYGTDTFSHRLQETRYLFFPSDEMWLIGLMGLLLAAFSLVILYRYLSSKEKMGQEYQLHRMKKFLKSYPSDENSYLLALKDKRYYFYQEDGEDLVLFAFHQQVNKLFVLGDPLGDTDKWKEATLDLFSHADELNYQVVFYKTSSEYALLLHDLGFELMKIGEEAYCSVMIPNAVMETKEASIKHLEQQGYSFRFFNQPVDSKWLEQLEKVDGQWCQQHTEKYFSYAHFDSEFIQQSRIGALFGPNQKVVAFAVLTPTYANKTISYDVLRYTEDAPFDVMEYFYVFFIQEARKLQLNWFDLGFSPLVNVGEHSYSFLQERLIRLFYQYGNHLYEVDEQYQDKMKFAQKWENRYLCYQKQSNPIFILIQLMLLLTHGKKSKSTIESMMIDS